MQLRNPVLFFDVEELATDRASNTLSTEKTVRMENRTLVSYDTPTIQYRIDDVVVVEWWGQIKSKKMRLLRNFK